MTFIVSSGHVEYLDDGRVLEPGIEYDLSSEEQKNNKAILKDGRLTEVPPVEQPKQETTSERKRREEAERKAAQEQHDNDNGGES